MPIGEYVAVSMHNGIGMLSGQFPFSNGTILHPGQLGSELTAAQGRLAARAAALNAIAHLKRELGDFKRLVGILRLDGIVAASEDFREHAFVLDGASEVFNEYFDRRGRHGRTLIPVSRLPMNACIELAVSFAVTQSR
jgi:enamine deaminase RidA (YjgF/YER057c/UK114 family)